MKKRLLSIFVFFTIISFYSLASAQSINDGFRGVPWGTSLSSFQNSNDFQFERKTNTNYYLFVRKNENMSFGNAQLSRLFYVVCPNDGFIGTNIKTYPGFGKTLIETVVKAMGRPTSYNVVTGDTQIFHSHLGGSSKDYDYLWLINQIRIEIEHQIARVNFETPNSPTRDVADMYIMFDKNAQTGGGF